MVIVRAHRCSVLIISNILVCNNMNLRALLWVLFDVSTGILCAHTHILFASYSYYVDCYLPLATVSDQIDCPLVKYFDLSATDTPRLSALQVMLGIQLYHLYLSYKSFFSYRGLTLEITLQ